MRAIHANVATRAGSGRCRPGDGSRRCVDARVIGVRPVPHQRANGIGHEHPGPPVRIVRRHGAILNSQADEVGNSVELFFGERRQPRSVAGRRCPAHDGLQSWLFGYWKGQPVNDQRQEAHHRGQHMRRPRISRAARLCGLSRASGAVTIAVLADTAVRSRACEIGQTGDRPFHEDSRPPVGFVGRQAPVAQTGADGFSERIVLGKYVCRRVAL